MRKIKFPFTFGTVHFVGIGGIGMSGIAEIMLSLGYKISGSDISENSNVQRLEELGIEVAIGHKPENIENAGVVVISSAISADNPEIIAAKEKKIPVIHRSDMLAELMKTHWSVAVGGTHGKTTTTALVSCILEYAGKQPTVINGGIINSSGTNAMLGDGDWMVVEADESDGSFIRFPSTIAVITNIDPDHMNFYKDLDDLKATFSHFANNVPFYGLVLLCIDSEEVQKIIPAISRPVMTYGFNPQADICASKINISKGELRFNVTVRGKKPSETVTYTDFFLPLYGEHNIKNALAAIGVALKLGIDIATVKQALATFKGVKRRFTQITETEGVTLIDDYAHHPTEITAVLKGARKVTKGKIAAVFQPHRYTRIHDLFTGFCTAFNNADTVIVTDIYPAGEAPIEGINKEAVRNGIIEYGHHNVKTAESFAEIPQMLADEVSAGDMVIFFGAGSISAEAYKMTKEITAALKNKKGKQK